MYVYINKRKTQCSRSNSAPRWVPGKLAWQHYVTHGNPCDKVKGMILCTRPILAKLAGFVDNKHLTGKQRQWKQKRCTSRSSLLPGQAVFISFSSRCKSLYTCLQMYSCCQNNNTTMKFNICIHNFTVPLLEVYSVNSEFFVDITAVQKHNLMQWKFKWDLKQEIWEQPWKQCASL